LDIKFKTYNFAGAFNPATNLSLVWNQLFSRIQQICDEKRKQKKSVCRSWTESSRCI